MQQVLGLVLGWVSSQGYLLLFVGMLLEGPIVTAGGSFAAALGVFNPWLVVVLSILGNLIPDAIYYSIGYFGRERVVDKYGHYLKITKERVRRLEELYHKHAGKTLLAVKLLPLLPVPGLIIAGVVKMPVKRFVLWSLVVTIPSSGIYFLIGYYFGAAYVKILRYVDYGGYLLLALLAVSLLVVYLTTKISRKIGEKIEKI